MAQATLNIRTVPRRMLSPRDAAEYCGLSAKTFVTLSGLPPVKMPNGSSLYDMRDLDTWLDSVKMSCLDSEDAIVERLGK